MFWSWHTSCLLALPVYVTRSWAFAVSGTRSDQFEVEWLTDYKRLIPTFLNLRNGIVWFDYGIRKKVPNVEASIPDWCDRYSLNEKKIASNFVRYRACRHSAKNIMERNRNDVWVCAEGRSKSPTPTAKQHKRYRAAWITLVTRQKSIGRTSQEHRNRGKRARIHGPVHIPSTQYVPLS